MLTKEQINKLWNRTPEERAEAERNRRKLTEAERTKLVREFNRDNLTFYKRWAKMELNQDEGPDMCECYEFRLWFFTEEKNVSYGDFKQYVDPKANELIDFFIKHPTVLPDEPLTKPVPLTSIFG